jgi:hypothetical protein
VKKKRGRNGKNFENEGCEMLGLGGRPVWGRGLLVVNCCLGR